MSSYYIRRLPHLWPLDCELTSKSAYTSKGQAQQVKHMSREAEIARILHPKEFSVGRNSLGVREYSVGRRISEGDPKGFSENFYRIIREVVYPSPKIKRVEEPQVFYAPYIDSQTVSWMIPSSLRLLKRSLSSLRQSEQLRNTQYYWQRRQSR